METTTLTAKLGLALAIAIIDVTATRASLAGVPRVHIFDGDTTTCRLVSEELLELEEVPLVELRPHLLAKLAPVPNPAEVFEDDRATGLEGTDDLLRDDVIHVGSEPSLLARNLRKVPLSRTCLRFLQLASQARISVTDTLDRPAAVELVGGCHGDLLDAPVHADYDAVVLDLFRVLLEDDVQVHLVARDHEVGTGVLPVEILTEVFRDQEVSLEPAVGGQETNLARLQE